jgi:hypothetical protein
MRLGVTVRDVVMAATCLLFGCNGVKSGGLNAGQGVPTDAEAASDGPSVGGQHPFEAGVPADGPRDARLGPPPDAPPGLDARPDVPPGCPANACGGCKTLTGRPGDACGSGCGQYRCSGIDEVVCDDPGLNPCGGCKKLPGAPGVACGGACGSYRCDGKEALTCLDPPKNACGGCKPLSGMPGASCGACGRLACNGADDLACTDPGKNSCGGCTPLAGRPGDTCGSGCGNLACSGTEALVCMDPGKNSCGGCKPLTGMKDAVCGDGGCGRMRCRGTDALECSGPAPNACGGCSPLPQAPGATCGTCGKIECEGKEGVRCVETVCGGTRPICLRATCVECTPGTKRCGPLGVQTCDSNGTFTNSTTCGAGTACQESGRDADCLTLSLATPLDGAINPAPTFSWTFSHRLPGARVCSVVMLDKGDNPGDGLGEDAFYAGPEEHVTPALDPLRYVPGTMLSWAVIAVACTDPNAACAQPCGDARTCATQGVLGNLPCQGTVLTSAQRHLTIDLPHPGPLPDPGPGPHPF